MLTVFSPEFMPYGKVVEGYDTAELLGTLAAATCPARGVVYVASEPQLEGIAVAKTIGANLYGGMPIQLGYCNGHNTKLNCLEYHRDSEVNLGTEDFILLLAKEDEIVDGMLDTAKVKAFLCPEGVMIEVYGTSLHYAPCQAAKETGFQVLVVLPRGTNGEKPNITPTSPEDKLLWACNKWLLAHAEATEAAAGAHVGLVGKNIDVAELF